MARGRRKQRRGAPPRQGCPPPPPLQGPLARIQEWIADAAHGPAAGGEEVPNNDGNATGSAGEPGPDAAHAEHGAQGAQPANVAPNNPAAAPRKQGKAKEAKGRGLRRSPSPCDPGYGLAELFRERQDHDDDVALCYAKLCQSRAKELLGKKDQEICEICFLHEGSLRSLKRERLKDHCKNQHQGGYLCKRKGCVVRSKTLREAGLHFLYLHGQGDRGTNNLHFFFFFFFFFFLCLNCLVGFLMVLYVRLAFLQTGGACSWTSTATPDDLIR
uniref:Uncharacterized protein n=1 Tax=Setaria italica TaxID=4555 RepID=K3ZNA0_SETIT